MVQKFLAIAAWALLAFITYATISPIHARPTMPTSSSFEHVTAFATLGMLFCLAYPRHIVVVCLIVFSSAILLETMQLLTLDRHGHVADAIEKLVGGAGGILAAPLVRLLARSNRWLRT
jgi:hypothetical protein